MKVFETVRRQRLLGRTSIGHDLNEKARSISMNLTEDDGGASFSECSACKFIFKSEFGQKCPNCQSEVNPIEAMASNWYNILLKG